MGVLSSIQDPVLSFVDGMGLIGLAILSFTEAIIQPIPPDLLVLPMLIGAEFDYIIAIWLVVTISSVGGSLVGYWLGSIFGKPLLNKFVKETTINRFENLTKKHGKSGVFIAALSPIPYKVFGWMAGIGKMEKKTFIVAGTLGRGLRFGIEALLIGIWGDKFLYILEWMIEYEWLTLIIMVLLIFCTIPIWKWWDNLANPIEEE
tara:strand:+ start:611 stop:1222 length:612 start_codon:yes stop_codon:yes gene_type:complete